MTATFGGKERMAPPLRMRSIGAGMTGRRNQKKKLRIQIAVSPRRMRNNPALDIDVEKGDGVPISAIIFGGRRSDTMPLVFQAFDWEHGVYIGATMASETTAAATGAVGQVRRDPMAMLPFCGYNIGDYFRHWLEVGKRLTDPPLIFNVNWFRKGADGKFLWPGFGENMRVLKWIIDRCEGRGDAVKSPIGWLPGPHDLDLDELDVEHKYVIELLGIDHEEWQKEIGRAQEVFRFVRRRRSGGIAETARTTRRAVQGIETPKPGTDILSVGPAGILPASSITRQDAWFPHRQDACAPKICEPRRNLESSPVGSKIAKRERVTVPVAKDCIEIRGARQNNLKAINVDLPLGKLTVVTGPSGSGKSSLAFETIYAEGQRRYVETFSPYMRQFLDRMDKPRVDDIRGIPPAIAIEQSNPVKSSRSTVGTMTEINDYLKLLWPRVARAFCPSCRREIRLETAKVNRRPDVTRVCWQECSHHFLDSSPRQDPTARFLRFSSAARLSAGVDRERNCARGCRAKNQEARGARAGNSGSYRDQPRKSRASGRSHRNGASFRKRQNQCNSCGGRRVACEIQRRGRHGRHYSNPILHRLALRPLRSRHSSAQVPGYSVLTIHSVRVPNAADSAARLRSILTRRFRIAV